MIAPTSEWNVVDYLESEGAIAEYLAAVFEDGNPRLIAAALGDVARALGIANLAERTGLPSESLIRSLSAEGNPDLATVLKVVSAFGLQLEARARPSRLPEPA